MKHLKKQLDNPSKFRKIVTDQLNARAINKVKQVRRDLINNKG